MPSASCSIPLKYHHSIGASWGPSSAGKETSGAGVGVGKGGVRVRIGVGVGIGDGVGIGVRVGVGAAMDVGVGVGAAAGGCCDAQAAVSSRMADRIIRVAAVGRVGVRGIDCVPGGGNIRRGL